MFVHPTIFENFIWVTRQLRQTEKWGLIPSGCFKSATVWAGTGRRATCVCVLWCVCVSFLRSRWWMNFAFSRADNGDCGPVQSLCLIKDLLCWKETQWYHHVKMTVMTQHLCSYLCLLQAVPSFSQSGGYWVGPELGVSIHCICQKINIHERVNKHSESDGGRRITWSLLNSASVSLFALWFLPHCSSKYLGYKTWYESHSVF